MWFFLIGLICSTGALHAEFKEVDYCAMMGRAESAAIKEISKKYGIRCEAKGGGAMCLVRLSDVTFIGQRSMTLEEARRLAVDCCEIYLKSINSYPELRPFLFEYPFPISRVTFTYDLAEEFLRTHPNSPVGGVSVISGKVIYYKDPSGLNEPDAIKEPYAEAKRIVLEEQKEQTDKKPEITTSKPHSGIIYEGKNRNIPRYTGPSDERKMSWTIDRYALQVAEKEGLQFHRVGNFSDSREVVYGLTFFDFHEKNLEEARSFARKLVADYLEFLRKTKAVLDYHKELMVYNRSMKYPPLISDEIVPFQLGVKIGYWDKEYNRPKKPAIAQMVFMEGVFRYYEADPVTEVLKLVFEEPYQMPEQTKAEQMAKLD